MSSGSLNSVFRSTGWQYALPFRKSFLWRCPTVSCEAAAPQRSGQSRGSVWMDSYVSWQPPVLQVKSRVLSPMLRFVPGKCAHQGLSLALVGLFRSVFPRRFPHCGICVAPCSRDRLGHTQDDCFCQSDFGNSCFFFNNNVMHLLYILKMGFIKIIWPFLLPPGVSRTWGWRLQYSFSSCRVRVLSTEIHFFVLDTSHCFF